MEVLLRRRCGCDGGAAATELLLRRSCYCDGACCCCAAPAPSRSFCASRPSRRDATRRMMRRCTPFFIQILGAHCPKATPVISHAARLPVAPLAAVASGRPNGVGVSTHHLLPLPPRAFHRTRVARAPAQREHRLQRTARALAPSPRDRQLDRERPRVGHGRDGRILGHLLQRGGHPGVEHPRRSPRRCRP